MLFYKLIRKDKKDCGIYQITFSPLILPVIAFSKSGERAGKENIIKQYENYYRHLRQCKAFVEFSVTKMQCKTTEKLLKKMKVKLMDERHSANVNMLVSL